MFRAILELIGNFVLIPNQMHLMICLMTFQKKMKFKPAAKMVTLKFKYSRLVRRFSG